ncbi:hypothetical protein RKE29_04580 [Streptomyces sp. B1866]|uniref:hypothetical protein n=1 Tax=Streptomyces sp. B1866 TaxID=3075431 RepID=UPI0028916B20|nr:hypothetical protein [Streptomyces sp. B1866]MDT3395925.1 hypothetical protein [Streptomyces sp. B1866]
MPGAEGESHGDPPYRVVVDETSFDFRELEPDRLTGVLDDFNDALGDILRERPVAAAEWWHEHACLDGCELSEFLYVRGGPGDTVSPDVRRRTALLMDRCRAWDTGDTADVPDRVHVAGEVRELAWTLGHALRRTLDGCTTACLVFPADNAVTRGWHPVGIPTGNAAAELYFLHAASDLTAFWRGLYEREDVPERLFPVLAADAFPSLVLASTLSFRKFDGTYRELRSWVAKVLAVLDDHFADALARHAGLPDHVQAELGRFGIDLSPESPNTRAKEKVMRQRYVEHEGETYRCEWHAKQHPARNRVHFTLPEQRLGGRILVGIFVNHLDT